MPNVISFKRTEVFSSLRIPASVSFIRFWHPLDHFSRRVVLMKCTSASGINALKVNALTRLRPMGKVSEFRFNGSLC